MSAKIEMMRQNALQSRRAVDTLLMNYVKARMEQHRQEILKANPDELIGVEHEEQGTSND